MSTADPLLQPFSLGGVRLRNRIFSGSYAPGDNSDGTPSDWLASMKTARCIGS